jgi:hypothetical protein
MGAMTGRGAGTCAGLVAPRFVQPGPGPGFGAGYGRCAGGRGWRNRFSATGQPGWQRLAPPAAPRFGLAPEQEQAALRDRAEALQSELEAIRKRLDHMDAAPKAPST